MSLNNSQKKYIRRNIKNFSLSQIAQKLQVSEDDVVEYVKGRWGEEKFRNFIDKYNGSEEMATSAGENNFDMISFLKKNWLTLVFLAILVIATYWNSLHNDFVSDDVDGILKNRNIGDLKAVFTSSSQMALFIARPIINFLAYTIGGLHPIFFRIPNIIFHIGTVWTIFVLLSIFQSTSVAFFAASIIAVHPIFIESVAWISGGHYAQAGFFMLLSLLLYTQKGKKWYYLSFLFFLIALSSNEKSICFPLILVFYEISRSSLQKRWKRLIPFLIAFLIGMTVFVSQIQTRVLSLKQANYQEVGVDNPLVQVPIAITSYLWLIIWPDKLTLYHSELTFSPLEYGIRTGFYLLFLAVIGYSFKKNKNVFFWLMVLPLSLLIVLTPLRISWVVAERYVYLGATAIITVFAILLGRIGNNKILKPLTYVIFIVIVISLMTRSIFRNTDWKNQDNLWIATGKTSPSDPKTHNNLGDVYGRNGNLDKAIEEFGLAIRINPRYAEAYHNIANIYYRKGDVNTAIENYNKALYFNPRLWQSYQTLGIVYFNIGQFDLAESYMKKAAEFNPTNAEIRVQLGVIYLQIGQKEKAKEQFYEALRIDPKNEAAKTGLKEALK